MGLRTPTSNTKTKHLGSKGLRSELTEPHLGYLYKNYKITTMPGQNLGERIDLLRWNSIVHKYVILWSLLFIHEEFIGVNTNLFLVFGGKFFTIVNFTDTFIKK